MQITRIPALAIGVGLFALGCGVVSACSSGYVPPIADSPVKQVDKSLDAGAGDKNKSDATVPPVVDAGAIPTPDAAASKCVDTCQTNEDCANSCPATPNGTNCCDTATNVCYVSASMCPAPVVDSGMTPPAY